MKITDLINLILLIAVIVLTVLWLNSRSTSDMYLQSFRDGLDSVEYYRDEASRSRARVKQIETTTAYLKATHQKLLDSIQANFKVKVRNLENYIATGIVEERVITVPITDTVVVNDTTVLWDKAFSYRDDWLDLKGLIGMDSLSLSYTSFDSLSIVQQRLSGGIETQILSHNPNTTLRGVTTFTIKSDRRFGLGFFAGPAVTLNGITPLAVGFGVNYRVW